jgi:RNA binding exosome subunit
MDEVVTQGHYGNKIGIVTVTLKGKNAFKTLKFIICSMERVDRIILVATVSNRAGHRPSHLYFRISKQEAYLGKVELMDGDDVIKVSVTVNGVRSVNQLKQFLEVLTSECANPR